MTDFEQNEAMDLLVTQMASLKVHDLRRKSKDMPMPDNALVCRFARVARNVLNQHTVSNRECMSFLEQFLLLWPSFGS